MTATELDAAFTTLGRMWGMGRRLKHYELAHVLLMNSSSIDCYRKGTKPIPRHIALLVWMMLDGARPRGLERVLGL